VLAGARRVGDAHNLAVFGGRRRDVHGALGCEAQLHVHHVAAVAADADRLRVQTPSTLPNHVQSSMAVTWRPNSHTGMHICFGSHAFEKVGPRRAPREVGFYIVTFEMTQKCLQCRGSR
jgi:hypothetical protein